MNKMRKTKFNKKKLAAFISIILLLAGAAIMLFPFLWSVGVSLMSPGDAYQLPPKMFTLPLRFDNYAKVWVEGNLGQYVVNSVFLTLICVVGAVFGNSIAGYALARYDSKILTVIFMAALATMYIPGNILSITQYIMWSKVGALDTYIPIIVPKFLGAASSIFLMRQCFKGMPNQFYEAASIDGLHPLRIFSKIYLPLAKPMITVLAIQGFMGEWNDIYGPLIYITDKAKYTLTIGLLYLRYEYQQNIEILIAAAVITMLPVVVVYLCGQKYFVSGMMSAGIKG